ncbi:hypothetical protein OBCHQ24_15500 [Oceanobacillus iheyensis]|nr:hypothetical protein OBCHQ24_15500 [Oceanobacillus iheyensis]
MINFILKFVRFIIVALLLIIFSDILLEDSNSGPVSMLAKELSFPFVSFVAQIDNYEFRWFSDILVSPLFILPERIWQGIFNIDLVSGYNTLIVAGARKGEGASGSVPIDMLTFGHLQASILGVVVVGLLWGILLFVLERALNRVKIHSFHSIIYANVVLNVAVQSVFYGDPQHIISRNFSLIGGVLLLSFLLKFSFRKQPKLKKSIKPI